MVDENGAVKVPRPVLRSELDLQLLTTDPAFGRADINPELYNKLRRQELRLMQKLDENGNPMYYAQTGPDGQALKDEKGNLLPDMNSPVMEYLDKDASLWAQLGIFTRDFRLGNLSKFDGEVAYVNYYLDLASKMVAVNMHEPTIICLANVASITEPSQSKSGFLRKMMNTLRQEHVNIDSEPKKANLFGKSRGGE